MVCTDIAERVKTIRSYNDWLTFAMKHYENPQLSSIEDFEIDIKRFSYVQSLLYRYKNKQELCDRLIINHIVILVNMFGPSATVVLFYAKADKKYWPALSSFFKLLNMIEKEEAESDQYVDSVLENI